MPNIQAAKKYLKASVKRAQLNNIKKRTLREAIKSTTDLIKDGKKKEATQQYQLAQKAIDKAIKSGVIKKNTGSRKKSRLAKKIKELA